MPAETGLHGGQSDLRNRRLQDMSRFVGVGEQTGSGLPKIPSARRQQHWRAPELVELRADGRQLRADWVGLRADGPDRHEGGARRRRPSIISIETPLR
jgi:hypothetical protein